MQPSQTITVAVDLSTLSTSALVNSVAITEQSIVGAALISGPPGAGLPAGGLAGQVPFKNSSADYDYINRNITESDVTNLTSDLTAKADKAFAIAMAVAL